MANRVPLIVDTSTLFIKELPLGDGLDLTGCSLVGVTSFTRGAGHEFSGITTFSSAVVFNDGITANTAKISDLTNNRVLLCTSGTGDVGDSANLTFDGSTLGITGAATVSTNLTVTGNAVVNGDTDLGNAAADTITALGRFDSDLIPSTGNTRDLGTNSNQWKDLYVDGVANVDNITVGVLTHTGLTQHRVVLATGSDGKLGDSAGLSYDGSTLAVTGDITATGNLNYQTVTDIRSVGVVTASSNLQVGAGISVVGVSTFTNDVNFVDQVNILDVKHTGIGTFNDVIVGGGLTVTGALNANGGIACDTNKFIVADTSGNTTIAGTLDVDGQTDLDVLNVAEAATLNDGVIVVGMATATSATIKAGADADANFYLYADRGDDNADKWLMQSESDGYFALKNYASGSWETSLKATGNLSVDLYYDNTAKFATSGVGASVYGTGALKIPVGTTGERPTTGDSPQNGDIRYNTSLNSYEGYGNGAWGGLGGGTEIDVTVSATSATNLTTFAKADYRSASLRVQIKQGTDYQVGRYLLIHDDTTATIVEEAAIATNSMLGTISAAINSANVEVKVTMGSASSATVTTIIDKITV